MRFQKGVGYPHPEQRPPRGPGDPGKPGGAYQMSRKAYDARREGMEKINARKRRTEPEIERHQVEVVLGKLRGESYRKLGKRLGISSTECSRIWHAYKAGDIEWLQAYDAAGLQELLDSWDREEAQEATRPVYVDRDIEQAEGAREPEVDQHNAWGGYKNVRHPDGSITQVRIVTDPVRFIRDSPTDNRRRMSSVSPRFLSPKIDWWDNLK